MGVDMKIKVIIPAYNEEDAIARVIGDIPASVNEVIVVSNNSTDTTEENAANAGATVLRENRRGYGYACLKGLSISLTLRLLNSLILLFFWMEIIQIIQSN